MNHVIVLYEYCTRKFQIITQLLYDKSIKLLISWPKAKPPPNFCFLAGEWFTWLLHVYIWSQAEAVIWIDLGQDYIAVSTNMFPNRAA